MLLVLMLMMMWGFSTYAFFSPARRITSEIKKNYFKINECGGGKEWRGVGGVM